MKKVIISLIILMVAFVSVADAQQNKTSTTNKKGKKIAPKPQQPTEVALPSRSSDCFFAAPLTIDVAFGPTEPLRGYGFVSEIKPDGKVKNVFSQEHNTVWYIVKIPYAGKLCIDITPKSTADDYDLLVYKYTDKYFCNRIIGNKVSPLRSIMSASDVSKGGKTGLSIGGTLTSIPKSSVVDYGKYIDVKEDEKYVIVVDNLTDGGLGHTILASINTNFAPLTVLPIDSMNRERTTANIIVTEAGTERVVFEREDAGAQKLKILPNKSYAISLKKDGYFNYFREVSHAQAIKDSILTARLIEIKVGANLPMKGDIYFDIDEQNNVTVMPDSYYVLEEIVKVLQEYPRISVDIIGRIATEGLNLRKDSEHSILRAEAIKNYLIGRGIPEANLRARGSYIKELEKQIIAQKKTQSLINPRCEIKITKTK